MLTPLVGTEQTASQKGLREENRGHQVRRNRLALRLMVPRGSATSLCKLRSESSMLGCGGHGDGWGNRGTAREHGDSWQSTGTAGEHGDG